MPAAISSVTRLTTYSPFALMLRKVSFSVPSGFRVGENAMLGGLPPASIMKLNGARLATPDGDTVLTKAIGRGITKFERSLYASVGVIESNATDTKLACTLDYGSLHNRFMIHGISIAATILLHQAPARRPMTPQAMITLYYATLNAATKSNDLVALNKWYLLHTVPEFAYTSFQKLVFKRDVFLAGLKTQTKAIQSVSKQQIHLGKGILSGNTFKVSTDGEFEGTVTFDGKLLLMTDSSQSLDFWSRQAGVWKLTSVKVTKEDVQMREHK